MRLSLPRASFSGLSSSARLSCCSSVAASSPRTWLPKSKGKGGGWLVINWGWGLAVFAGVYVAFRSGGHLNPAVTIAKAVGHAFDSSVELAPGVAVNATNILVYIVLSSSVPSSAPFCAG